MRHNLSILFLLVTSIISLEAFAVEELTVLCYLPERSLLFEIQAEVSPSDPNLHVEDYVLDGEIHITSDHIRGTRRGIRVVGTYDNVRGVKRISIRPNAIQQFSIFSKLTVKENFNKRQFVNFTSSQSGLGGVSAGSFCQIHEDS